MNDDDDDFEGFFPKDLSVGQKLSLLVLGAAAFATLKGAAPGTVFKMYKLGATGLLVSSPLGLALQGGHSQGENSALQYHTPPGVTGVNPPPTIPVAPAAPTPTTRLLLTGSAQIAAGARRTGVQPAIRADERTEQLVTRLGTASRVFGPRVDATRSRVPSGFVSLAGAVPTGAAMGSFAAELVEAVNDSGIRNGGANKGIGRILIHERADP